LQIALGLLVGPMLEPAALRQRLGLLEAQEHRILTPRPLHHDADALDDDRHTRLDLNVHVPDMLGILGLNRGVHLRLVVAKGAQCRAYLLIGTPIQPLDRLGLNPLAILVALQAQQRLNVATQIRVHPVDVDTDTGLGCGAPGEQAQQERSEGRMPAAVAMRQKLHYQFRAAPKAVGSRFTPQPRAPAQ